MSFSVATQFKPNHHSRTERQPCQLPGHTQETYLERGKPRRRCRQCTLRVGRESAHRRQLRRREAAFDHYGRVCVCCGESTPVFLGFDHIDGNGNQHRRDVIKTGRAGSTKTLMWMEENGYPPIFQTMCFNCNYAKHALGECPHAQNRQLAAT